MASITKRGKTYQYSVSRIIDGKYSPIRKGGFRTKKEAAVAAAEIEANLAKGIEEQFKSIEFAQYFLDWFNTYKIDISSITRNSYVSAYNKILEYFKDTPIQEITKRNYQTFLNLLGETRAKTTNKKMNGYVRSCLKEAIEEGIITKNFTNNITITGLDGKKDSEKFLDYLNSQLLMQDLHKNIDIGIENMMLILALASGVRYGELVGLRICDLDFKNNLIKIRVQWKYKEGGGFGDLKNDNSERTLSVDATTMKALKKHTNNVENHPDNIHKLVFFDPTSDVSVVTNDRINDVLKAILKRLNIGPEITIHGLRHTHASILLYKGVSILYVSERLGHSGIDVTSSTYAHVLKELRERESEQTVNIFENLY